MIRRTATTILLVVGATACASTTPPRELRDARAAYSQAARSPNAGRAPVELREAQKALAAAENEFDDEGDELSTRDLAYAAQRKALAAQAAGNAAGSLQAKQLALQDLERAKQAHAQATTQELDKTKQSLSQTEQRLENERQAHAAADQRANDALAKIEGLKAEQSDRGLV